MATSEKSGPGDTTDEATARAALGQQDVVLAPPDGDAVAPPTIDDGFCVRCWKGHPLHHACLPVHPAPSHYERARRLLTHATRYDRAPAPLVALALDAVLEDERQRVSRLNEAPRPAWPTDLAALEARLEAALEVLEERSRAVGSLVARLREQQRAAALAFAALDGLAPLKGPITEAQWAACERALAALSGVPR